MIPTWRFPQPQTTPARGGSQKYRPLQSEFQDRLAIRRWRRGLTAPLRKCPLRVLRRLGSLRWVQNPFWFVRWLELVQSQP